MKLSKKQQELLATAKDLFCERGYVQTSVRDLAQAQNVKASSLYSHFASKEEILRFICQENYEIMMEGKKRIMDFQGEQKERFLFYIELHLSAILSNRQSFKIYLNYRHHLEGEHRSFYKEIDESYLELLCDIFYSAYPHYKD